MQQAADPLGAMLMGGGGMGLPGGPMGLPGGMLQGGMGLPGGLGVPGGLQMLDADGGGDDSPPPSGAKAAPVRAKKKKAPAKSLEVGGRGGRGEGGVGGLVVCTRMHEEAGEREGGLRSEEEGPGRGQQRWGNSGGHTRWSGCRRRRAQQRLGYTERRWGGSKQRGATPSGRAVRPRTWLRPRSWSWSQWWCVAPCYMSQEEEERAKPGTTKHAAIQVLKAFCPYDGLTVEQVREEG